MTLALKGFKEEEFCIKYIYIYMIIREKGRLMRVFFELYVHSLILLSSCG